MEIFSVDKNWTYYHVHFLHIHFTQILQYFSHLLIKIWCLVEYPTGFNGSNAVFYSNCGLGARITHYSMHIPIKRRFMTTESNFNTKKRTGKIFWGKILSLFVIISTFYINSFITRKIAPRLIFDSEFTTFTCSHISQHKIKNDTFPKKHYFMLLPLKSPFYLLDFFFQTLIQSYHKDFEQVKNFM